MRLVGFRHKGLKRLYDASDARGLRAELAAKIVLILHAIEQAKRIEQVALFPGWRLHPLKGDRQGTWSVRATGNFRLTFRVDGEDVSEIDLEDYH
jgi:proteic killer suppression protein